MKERLKRLKLSPTKLLRERVTHVHRVVDPKGGCTRGGLTDTIHYCTYSGGAGSSGDVGE